MKNTRDSLFSIAAMLLLALMAVLAGGAALRESVTIDEVAHIGAGVSYLQKLDLRFNEEHPPLPKILAALPLVLRGARADYSHISWTFSESFFPAYVGQWIFGQWLLTKWNDPALILPWARAPMLLLTLFLGWVVFAYARRLGGNWAGLLCLSVFVSTSTFIAFGPLVITDLPITLFSVLTLWNFAEVWENPTRKNIMLFSLCLAGALLSKFTASILFFAFIAFALSTRWRAVPPQPATKPEARIWRRARWRATLKGILGAALVVYLFYFIFSIHQSTDALNRLGHGAATEPFRRLLMPAWLYLRGMLLVLITGSRPTFILGRSYPHGVWFYFPVVFLLKSHPAFLALLALAAALRLALKKTRREHPDAQMIPNNLAIHRRVLWVSLIVFTGFCLLSRLDISIRHFCIPIVLLILLLAPLPRQIERLRSFSLTSARIAAIAVVVLVLICLSTAVRFYPYYFPYVNALSFGHPAYELVNDSNIDWNQSLPEARRFAERHGIQKINLDEYGFTDPTVTVPQAEVWNCQQPASADSEKWAVLSANMILDGHNCAWLLQYPHEPLAGGSMYAFHLPERIPEAGSPGGPPLPSAFRQFAGAPIDMRGFFLDLMHNPEGFPKAMEEMQARFKSQNKPETRPPKP
ncbi:MAG: glycosyltransferase family 39 protein [Candidatus Acidiferrum sp.]